MNVALRKTTKRRREGRGSARYPAIHWHLTGDELCLYIKKFDALNNFVKGTEYIINAKKIKV